MKALKYWASNVAMDLLVAALFYFWWVQSVQGAGNALAFILWAFICMRILVSFVINKEVVSKQPRPACFAEYHYTTEIATTVALAWVGWTWTAGFYLLALILFEATRQREPKQTTKEA